MSAASDRLQEHGLDIKVGISQSFGLTDLKANVTIVINGCLPITNIKITFDRTSPRAEYEVIYPLGCISSPELSALILEKYMDLFDY